MRQLLATTALVLAALPALAAEHVASPFLEGYGDGQVRTESRLVGRPVYLAEAQADLLAGQLAEDDAIGAIESVVVNAEGHLRAVIVDAGGYLGVDRRPLVIDARRIEGFDRGPDAQLAVRGERELVEEAPFDTTESLAGRTAGTIDVDNEGSGMTTQSSPNLVTEDTRSQPSAIAGLSDGTMEGTETNLPNLDEGTVVDNPATPATAVIRDGQVDTEVDAPTEPEPTAAEINAEREGDGVVVADNAAEAPRGDVPLLPNAPAVEREDYTPLMFDTLRLPQLEGVDVYDLADEVVGTIEWTIPGDSRGDQLETSLAVVGIGGFLGLGERDVAIPLEAMTFLDGEGGLRAYIDATQEQLDALPEYER
ncbi:hypothetical protein [Jannaschia sp. W003]|uniref:hypothetical protein n=1 Tax=Jannaschia sp. W003 TaxID=2867012 RepID=UPI0021A79E76|nr:hypothetical protein [Jannaschia sp. W003]UWQ21124.1 hypothetical protein K3554_14285 [Jannaschia sp. W003]